MKQFKQEIHQLKIYNQNINVTESKQKQSLNKIQGHAHLECGFVKNVCNDYLPILDRGEIANCTIL